MVSPGVVASPGVPACALGKDAGVPDPIAELSSVATVLDDLTSRVVTIADSYRGGERDDVATQLDEVERALIGARRRLGTVLNRT